MYELSGDFFLMVFLEKKLCCPKHFCLIVLATTSIPKNFQNLFLFLFFLYGIDPY
jgi:hypothetical protein